MSRKLTYGDFMRSGFQDCANVFNTDDHWDTWRRLGKPRSPTAAVARRVVRETWGDDAKMYEQWSERAPISEIVREGLSLRDAYKAWRDAWQDCATSTVMAEMKQWIERDDEDRA